MRINYESWWRSKYPDYPHTMLTEIFDPCKVQAEMPEVDFVSAGVLYAGEQPNGRIWGFRFQSDMLAFASLIKEKQDLLRVTVG